MDRKKSRLKPEISVSTASVKWLGTLFLDLKGIPKECIFNQMTFCFPSQLMSLEVRSAMDLVQLQEMNKTMFAWALHG